MTFIFIDEKKNDFYLYHVISAQTFFDLGSWHVSIFLIKLLLYPSYAHEENYSGNPEKAVGLRSLLVIVYTIHNTFISLLSLYKINKSCT